MPAAARPYWTGFLKLSLVTISVRLYTATTERERIHFHQIHEPSGERVRYQSMVPGIGPVERDEIVKGYEYEKGRYVTIDPDDLKKLHLETTDTIDIVEFVDQSDVDPIFLDNPYYLVPDGSTAEEAYRVLCEALERSRKTAIGRVVIGGHERVVAVGARDKGLLVHALRFADEVRRPEEFFAGIGDGPVNADELALMTQIITQRTRPFAPEKFVDHYQAALKELVEEKLGGKLPAAPPKRPPAQVIKLMDALKKSLATAGEEPRQTAPQGRAPKKARAVRSAAAERNQRTLLLPVTGGRRLQEEPARPAKRAVHAPEPPRRGKKA
jgi:DNA end-binding protein Ku